MEQKQNHELLMTTRHLLTRAGSDSLMILFTLLCILFGLSQAGGMVSYILAAFIFFRVWATLKFFFEYRNLAETYSDMIRSLRDSEESE